MGQFLRIDQGRQLVVAMTSAWAGPGGWDPAKARAFHEMLDSMVRALGHD